MNVTMSSVSWTSTVLSALTNKKDEIMFIQNETNDDRLHLNKDWCQGIKDLNDVEKEVYSTIIKNVKELKRLSTPKEPKPAFYIACYLLLCLIITVTATIAKNLSFIETSTITMTSNPDISITSNAEDLPHSPHSSDSLQQESELNACMDIVNNVDTVGAIDVLNAMDVITTATNVLEGGGLHAMNDINGDNNDSAIKNIDENSNSHSNSNKQNKIHMDWIDLFKKIGIDFDVSKDGIDKNIDHVSDSLENIDSINNVERNDIFNLLKIKDLCWFGLGTCIFVGLIRGLIYAASQQVKDAKDFIDMW